MSSAFTTRTDDLAAANQPRDHKEHHGDDDRPNHQGAYGIHGYCPLSAPILAGVADRAAARVAAQHTPDATV